MAENERDYAPEEFPTEVKRTSDREMVITRTFSAPARLVFEAWTKAERFQRWWVPKSMGARLVSCELDVRTGGRYRLVFAHGPSDTMAFFGRYTGVIPNERIVWTNEESPDGSVTTVTLEDRGGTTRLMFHELYPSKEVLDGSFEGMGEGMREQFGQLDDLLLSLGG